MPVPAVSHPSRWGALGAGGTITEYGDNFDPMGYYNLGHYGAQHKVQLGWLNPSNALTVQSSGTYSVAPLGIQTSATQALQVQRGTGNPDWLWIEYHQPVGNYESQLSSQIYSGATIRYLDSLTGAGYTNLLDFTPTDGSWMDPALAAGQSWADPYTNVSLSINSATSSALTVGVNYGVTPCTPGTPSLAGEPVESERSCGIGGQLYGHDHQQGFGDLRAQRVQHELGSTFRLADQHVFLFGKSFAGTERVRDGH